MSAIQLNDSLFNISVTCMVYSHSPAGLSIWSVVLLSNFVLGLPVNVLVVWLICHGTREMLASEIYFLSLAVCEILYCLGLPAQLYCMYSFERVSRGSITLSKLLWPLVWIGRPIFQSCISVERYIAVVHPLIFIRLKPMKYRVAQCALAWCVLFLIVSLIWSLPRDTDFVLLIWFMPTLCMLAYCYFSVLCSLKQPGPGEREGARRRRGDNMKTKAFNIILVHLLCFLFNYLPTLIVYSLKRYVHMSDMAFDLLGLGIIFGQVQPLLYLHRAGKLPCFKRAST